jgi:HD-like signal output (HDOD) protein
MLKIEDLLIHPDLPSLPEAVIRLNELISSDAPIDKIAAVIENEPALTLRTLELANSAWYKREKTIQNVNEAISVIGFTALYQLIFATSVTRVFHGVNSDQIDMQCFWQQSVRAATLAQTLSSRLEDTPQHLFTTGLIMYIGKLILATTAPFISYQIYKQCKEESIPLSDAETNRLGFNHADVSAAIIEKWKMPASMYVPIKYYLQPENAPEQYQPIAALLHIAHTIRCMQYPDESVIVETTAEIDPSICNMIKINESQFPKLAESASNLYDEALSLLGLSS